MLNKLTGSTATPKPAPLPTPKDDGTVQAPAPKSTGSTSGLSGDEHKTSASTGANAASKLGLGGVVSSGPKAKDLRDFGKYLLDQGDSNGCGTTSLAMMLNYWKGDKNAFSREKIDDKIRTGPDQMAFSSPDNLESYAKDNGFRSNAISGGSMDQLKGYLDQGVPVQVLYDPNNDGGDSLLHYVNVVGYTEKDGQIDQIKIADPAGGETKEISREEFENRWSDLELGGIGTGLNNVMIVTLPGENTPIRDRDGNTIMSDDIDLPEGDTGWSGKIADLISDTTNFVSNGVETVKDGAETVVEGAKDLWDKVF